MIYATRYDSPLCPLTVACDERSIVGLWMEGQKYYGGTLPGEMTNRDDLPVLMQARHWLDSYFAGERPSIADLPLAPIGGDFRQTVWRILCEIPYGECITYGDIAARIAAKTGKPSMSSQAVGGAVGHNPISIIIPCHRVVGSNGSLTGYAGGIDNKIKLLAHEGVNLSRLRIPTRGTAL